MIVSGPTTRTWFNALVLSELELIDTFVVQMEVLVENSINEYRAKKTTRVDVEVDDEGYEHGQIVEEFANMDDSTWNLQHVFEQHFPSLHRGSAFITVCSFFEEKLQELCGLFKDELTLELEPDDLRGAQGLEQTVNYLRKVVHLRVARESDEWVTVSRLRHIRNVVVHNDARPKKVDGGVSNEVKDALQNLKFVRLLHSQMVFEKGFVAQAVTIWRDYCAKLNETIQKS